MKNYNLFCENLDPKMQIKGLKIKEMNIKLQEIRKRIKKLKDREKYILTRISTLNN